MHPLLMTTFLLLILLFFEPILLSPLTEEQFWRALVVVLLITFAIPLLGITSFRVTRSISSVHLENRKERIIPFLFIGVFYAINAYLFTYKLYINDLIVIGTQTNTILIFVIWIITFFWKISVHSAAIGGLTGFLMALVYRYPEMNLIYPAAICTFLTGAVMSARLYLNAHSLGQTVAGLALGFVTCFSSMFWFID